jgi:hypothetical protein
MTPTDTKRRLFLLAAMLSSTSVLGTPPLDERPLDQSSMEALGFTLTTFEEQAVQFAQLLGPREVEGCPARRAGSVLFGAGEEVLAFQSAWFESSGVIQQPIAEVSFGAVASRARLFIDYICASTQKSGRYTIEVRAADAAD